mmetsp:Transcript_51213/g.111308  ORF Transcript_51213/g.111308 Transcript_51213/m.111308 type:complete len:232 (+) Transcript_51213:1586-2281(+)
MVAPSHLLSARWTMRSVARFTCCAEAYLPRRRRRDLQRHQHRRTCHRRRCRRCIRRAGRRRPARHRNRRHCRIRQGAPHHLLPFLVRAHLPHRLRHPHSRCRHVTRLRVHRRRRRRLLLIHHRRRLPRSSQARVRLRHLPLPRSLQRLQVRLPCLRRRPRRRPPLLLRLSSRPHPRCLLAPHLPCHHRRRLLPARPRRRPPLRRSRRLRPHRRRCRLPPALCACACASPRT